MAQAIETTKTTIDKEPKSIEKDSIKLDSSKIKRKLDPLSINYIQTSFGLDTFIKWDSAFSYTHRFHKLIEKALPFTDLGASFTPQKVLLSSQSVPFGYFSGFTLYQQNQFIIDSFKFYRAKVPQSTFQYTQGNGPFIELKGMLTQNFGKNWNFTANLNSHTHNDNIININSGINQLFRSTAFGNLYLSPNKKLIHSHIFSWNRAKRNETYGYDTSTNYFLPSSGLQRNLGFYKPLLTSAISILKTHEHVSTTTYKVKSNMYVFHKLSHLKTGYEFRNAEPASLSLFGSLGRYQTNKTADSSVWNLWSNQIGLGKNNSSYFWRTVWEASRGSHSTVYKTKSRVNYLQAIHFNGGISFNTLHLNTQAKFMFAGNQAGDILFETKLSNSKFGLTYTFQKYTPFQKQQIWVTNFHLFNASLKQTTHQKLDFNALVKIRKQLFIANIEAGNYANFTYFNSNLAYLQANSISYLQARIKIALTAGFWHFDNFLTLQNNTNKTVLNVPTFTTQSAIYWEANLFKKAMRTRIGLDFFYMSKFKQYAFIPTAAEFALTNNDGGNYPLFDLFLNGQIKNFNLFFKLEHWNSPFVLPNINPEFTSSYLEPMQRINFKLGIGWRFFN